MIFFLNLFLTLQIIFMSCCTSSGQSVNYENYEKMPALGRGPLPMQQNHPTGHVKPARTIADVAEEYWIANQCVYPPRAFFSMFRDGCEVRLKAETFYAGICHAFFNSSKSLCTLDDATEDETQTLLSLHQLQATIENDALCDTLAEMKANDPFLFPQEKDFTKKEKWFSLISSLIFSPDTCSSACGMDNVHPICFGYMLNYNYIETLKTKQQEKEKEEETQDIDEDAPKQDEEEDTEDKEDADDSEKEPKKSEATGQNKNSSAMVQDVKDQDIADSPVTVDTFEPVHNLTIPYRPNPKLVNNKESDSEPYYYGAFGEDEDFETEGAGSDVILSDVLEKNSDLLSDMLEIEDSMMDDKPISDNVAADYPIDPDFAVDDLPQLTDELMNKIEAAEKEKQIERGHKRPRLRGHVVSRMDRSEEVPMLAVLLAFSGFLVVVSLFFIFRLRKKIGGYVRHMRQRRRNNNWNYERVLIVQADDDDYYGD